jgi:hypothetical protein
VVAQDISVEKVGHTLVETIVALLPLLVNVPKKLLSVGPGKQPSACTQGSLYLLRVIPFPDVVWLLQIEAEHVPVLFDENGLVSPADSVKDLLQMPGEFFKGNGLWIVSHEPTVFREATISHLVICQEVLEKR